MSPGRELVERIQRATLAWQAIETGRRADGGPRERSRWLGNGWCGYWVIAATASAVVVAQWHYEAQAAGPAAEVKSGSSNFPRDTPERRQENRRMFEILQC